MRVLAVGNMYPPHSEGGYELVFQGAVRALRGAGHEVRVLVSNALGPAPAGVSEEDPDVHRELLGYWRGHRFVAPMSPRARLAMERRNAAILERHLAGLRPEVVTWWSMGGMSLGLVEQVRRSGLPAVALVSDDWLVYGPKADQWQRLGHRLGPLAPAVERMTGLPMSIRQDDSIEWLFVSESTRRAAADAGWRPPRTGIASTGVDMASLTPAPPRKWSGDLLYVGRIDPRKGIDAAVHTVALMDGGVRLTVVGHGDERHRSYLARLALRLGVHDKVELLPGRPRSEVTEMFASHDAVLFPVRWPEPWGLVPLEAMAVGRPVVASGRGGSAEYLRDGENCLIADPDRPQTIGAAIERLARDERLRARLRAGGMETAQRHTARQFEARVREAVEAAGRAR